MDLEISDSKIEKVLLDERNTNMLGLTSAKVSYQIGEIIEELNEKIPRTEIIEIKQKLKNYKYVDEISDLKEGSYIRWISLTDDNCILRKGALYCDVKITDTEILLLCKTVYNNKMFYLKLDENIIFQKLLLDDIILLTVLDYYSK